MEDEITYENVTEFSRSYKKMQEIGLHKYYDTKEILILAINFLKNNCIDYDKEHKYYTCKPYHIRGKKTYKIRFVKGGFSCDCERSESLPQIDGLICEHTLALKLMLKIWNSQKRREKELYGCDAI